jgi:ferredoxin
MSNLKRVTISEKCILCGLCELDQYKKIFSCDANGTIQILHNGLVDIDVHPELLEASKMCPTQAIQIQEEETTSGSKEDNLKKLNDLIYKRLRDYSFAPPEVGDYKYKTGVYKASKIPAQYRSDNKYRTDDAAQEAGVRAFKSAVWSQAKNIARQYIVAYRVKQLKKYYTYEQEEDNFYFSKNMEIKGLLTEAANLASCVTEGKIKLPKDFCEFEVRPDWGYDNITRDSLAKLEDLNFDFECSSSFHDVYWYDCWISVDDYGDDKYFYDFEEAESQFRDDMDSVVDDVLYNEVQSRVNNITGTYLNAAQNLLLSKVDLLQAELRKYIQVDSAEQQKQVIENICSEIAETSLPKIPLPQPDVDLLYNSDYRFHSESSCEEASENRRERAYKEGLCFVEHLPETLSQECAEQVEIVLTKWKREILPIYSSCGNKLASQKLCVTIDDDNCVINLDDFDNVNVPVSSSIRRYISSEILRYGTSVDDVRYMSKYDCKIRIYHDYDLKETFFGNFKEVNHRYCYDLDLYEFDESARLVGKACVKKFEESAFWKQYFDSIKRSLIKSLRSMFSVS